MVLSSSIHSPTFRFCLELTPHPPTFCRCPVIPRLSITLLCAITCLAFSLALPPSTAQAQEAQARSWVVLPFDGGSDLGSEAEVVTQLVATEMAGGPGISAQVAPQGAGCRAPACAAEIGKSMGAQRVIYGSLNTLGIRILVNATEVDVASGNVVSGQRFSVEKVEELEEASARLARAFLTGERVQETAELGNITEKEAMPERRRQGVRGTSLGVQGLFPFADAYGDTGPGIGLALGYWYEAASFAIEPRLGVRFSTGTDATDNSFFALPLDLNAYYIASLGNVAPFVGGGAGARYMRETLVRDVTTGSVIKQRYDKELQDSGWGFGLNARLGLMFFRTYSVRTAISAAYDVTFIKLNDRANPQAAMVELSVFF